VLRASERAAAQALSGLVPALSNTLHANACEFRNDVRLRHTAREATECTLFGRKLEHSRSGIKSSNYLLKCAIRFASSDT
jgi:hypothetical protein